MAKFTVMPVFTATAYEDVEADTPEDAIDASESHASLCHQCGNNLDIEDVYFHIVLDEDGEEVYRDDPLDASRAELTTLRAQLARYEAVVEAAREWRAREGLDVDIHYIPHRRWDRLPGSLAVLLTELQRLDEEESDPGPGQCPSLQDLEDIARELEEQVRAKKLAALDTNQDGGEE